MVFLWFSYGIPHGDAGLQKIRESLEELIAVFQGRGQVAAQTFATHALEHPAWCHGGAMVGKARWGKHGGESTPLKKGEEKRLRHGETEFLGYQF